MVIAPTPAQGEVARLVSTLPPTNANADGLPSAAMTARAICLGLVRMEHSSGFLLYVLCAAYARLSFTHIMRQHILHKQKQWLEFQARSRV